MQGSEDDLEAKEEDGVLFLNAADEAGAANAAGAWVWKFLKKVVAINFCLAFMLLARLS